MFPPYYDYCVPTCWDLALSEIPNVSKICLIFLPLKKDKM